MGILRRKSAPRQVVKPSWEELIKIMKDEGLHFTKEYEVADVIYSTDGAHRFVILKAAKGFLTYSYETLHALDEDELRYVPAGAPPGYWNSFENGYKPVFDDMNILLRELKAEPAYKAYFGEE